MKHLNKLLQENPQDIDSDNNLTTISIHQASLDTDKQPIDIQNNTTVKINSSSKNQKYKRKLTKLQEKKMIKSLLRNDFDWSCVLMEFSSFSQSELEISLYRLMKRALSKINRENKHVLKSSEIRSLNINYMYRICKSFCKKKIQKMGDCQVLLIDLLSNYMFKTKNKIAELYNEEEKKIIRFLLVRTVEIFEIEE